MNVSGRIESLCYQLKKSGVLDHDNKLTGDFRPSVVLTPDEMMELMHGLRPTDGWWLRDGEIEYRGFLIFVRPERRS